MKIGVGQSDFTLGNPQRNCEHVASLLADAAQQGVDVLVLPELASSGYAFTSTAEAWAASELVPGGPFGNMLADWSKPGRLVVSGICERAGDKVYNSAAVYGGGQHLATYRKLHLFNTEKPVFTPGEEEPPVVEFGGFRYGVLICYDWFFPEVSRLLALRGAHILLHPANLVLSHCQEAMKTRSIENRVFTATANRIGEERGIAFTGKSQITAQNGSLLCRAESDSTGVISAEVDLTLAASKRVTERNDLFGDRRPEFYSGLIDLG
jgi:predicted amidohydrolase